MNARDESSEPAEAPQGNDSGDPAALTYEQAVARLQEIIERIEAGEVGLEESLQQYERGMAMIKRCQAILDRAEAKIRKLTVTEQGGLVDAADADADADADANANAE